MQIESIIKIDGWGGNVLLGDPVPGDLVRITFDNVPPTVVEKIYWPPQTAPAIFYVYIHVDVSGPTPPGMGDFVSIQDNGTSTATLTFTLRHEESPTSDVIVHTRYFLITFRDVDDNVYDTIGIQFVDGIATVPYTSTKSGIVTIQSKDIDAVLEVGELTAVVTLASSPRFLVYRNFV